MRCGKREELGRRKSKDEIEGGKRVRERERTNERVGSEKSTGLALIEKTLTPLAVSLPLFPRHSSSRFFVAFLRGLQFISLEICEV